MNNMNKARIRTTWLTISTTVLMLTFGLSSHAEAQVKTQEAVVYSKEVLYVNKYINLVNLKNTINIDIKQKSSSNTAYIVEDLARHNSFVMPSYSKLLNLKSRVDKRVIISRLANAIKSQETGGVGSYYRKSYSSSACGAFQYMSTSWNNFMGYKSACDAPEWVQDQRMINELESSYNKYHDWRKVVAAHLYPIRAGNMNSWYLLVPGNPTVFQYVTSVFQKANIAY